MKLTAVHSDCNRLFYANLARCTEPAEVKSYLNERGLVASNDCIDLFKIC